MKKKFVFVFLFVFAVIVLAAFYNQFYASQRNDKAKTVSKVYCKSDRDCVCGIDKETKACSYGNKKFIDTSEQCPDFCTGIDGDLTIKCISDRCVQGVQ